MTIWDQVKEFFQYQFLSVALWRIIAALAIFFIALILKRFVAGRVTDLLLRLAKRTKTTVDDLLVEALRAPIAAFFVLAGLFGAVVVLQFPRQPTDVHGFVMGLLRTAGIILAAWALYRSIRVVSVMLTALTQKTESELDDQLVPFVEKFLKVVVVVIGFVIVIREWGYDISGLLAGLGLGGLAFALAAKDTLANLFGSIMILTDRPFGLGDWIKTPQVEGTVEEIGFRSTRVRTFANSQVTVPNSIVAAGTVENWSRMLKRRISYTLGVTYATSVSQLKETLERIKDIVRNHPGIRQDFWLVNFTEFNESSLDIMIYCFTNTTVWGEFLAVREDLNMKIMDAIKEIGVEVAFPTHSVYMETLDQNEQDKLDKQAQALLATRSERSSPEQTITRGSGEG
ncbi:MAG: mechanosensitive ion channel family protein [Bradymonadales bacterium]|nr:mechanosensitive ion channel family protein [Bradymonadales bacterium]